MNEEEKQNLLENKLQNALMYLNQANKILHSPTHKRVRREKPVAQEKLICKFGKKQLEYIRNTYTCMIKERVTCNYSHLAEKAITRLNNKDLKIINICQKGLGFAQFEDVESFLKCDNINS